MNRRSFLKFAGLAGAALATVGINPLPTAAPLPAPLEPIPDAINYWYGATFITDVDCPDDRVYFINLSAVHAAPDGSWTFDGKEFGVVTNGS